jgi:hypothetical protein
VAAARDRRAGPAGERSGDEPLGETGAYFVRVH